MSEIGRRRTIVNPVLGTLHLNTFKSKCGTIESVEIPQISEMPPVYIDGRILGEAPKAIEYSQVDNPASFEAPKRKRGWPKGKKRKVN